MKLTNTVQYFETVLVSARKPDFYTRYRTFRLFDVEKRQVQVNKVKFKPKVSYSLNSIIILVAGSDEITSTLCLHSGQKVDEFYLAQIFTYCIGKPQAIDYAQRVGRKKSVIYWVCCLLQSILFSIQRVPNIS